MSYIQQEYIREFRRNEGLHEIILHGYFGRAPDPSNILDMFKGLAPFYLIIGAPVVYTIIALEPIPETLTRALFRTRHTVSPRILQL